MYSFVRSCFSFFINFFLGAKSLLFLFNTKKALMQDKMQNKKQVTNSHLVTKESSRVQG
jgi:hypothetical protein